MAIFSSFKELNIEGDTNGAIVLREEQKEAISRAKKHFEGKADYLKFLWNAKMRFGKTICAMHLAREMGVKSCLIVTHRPVVNGGWKEDFQKTFRNDPHYRYGTLFRDRDNNDKQNEGDYYELERFSNQEGNLLVFFVSMQYLCLSPEVNTNTRNRATDNDNNKLKAAILKKEWDLVVVDEAHEGTRTALGLRVIDMLSKPKTKVLHLSGTPFNLYHDFRDSEIFNWDYIREQRAKNSWSTENPGKPNPYAGLPRMNIYTYDLAELLKDYDDLQQSFRFSEFFRTWSEKRDKGHIPDGKTGKFIHEKDVKRFLDLLCEKSDKTGYPFSTDEYRKNFRHTLWVVPGVSEAKALKELLDQHSIFRFFNVINVAGNNEEDETRSNALDNVTNTIGADPNSRFTITISCGRLTTGVTVPPWTAVFYLKGSENTSASTYLQTIFRVQSPWEYYENGKRCMKTECYVFDFAPTRTLRMMAETAKFSVDTEDENDKKKKKEKGKRPSTQDDKDKMREFLNFCPVVSMAGGEMVPYDAENLFAQLDRVYIDRVVRNGFNDNSLYNVQELLKLDADALNRLGELISKSSNLDKPKNASPFVITGNNPQNKPKTNNREGDSNIINPEEEAQRQEENERKKKEREERDNRITILRGISLRIPLLIYGAELRDEASGITIDNFTEIVDDDSWAEFMPRGISKEDFNSFKVAYNPTVFVESGKRIRALAQEADDMPTDLRIQRIAEIFSYFHNPDKETVLTPWRVVNMHMSDCIGGYCFFNEKFDGPNQKEIIDETTGESKFEDTHEPRFVSREKVTTEIFAQYNLETQSYNSKILEINSKTGLYPLYVAYSLFRFRCANFIEANLIKNPDNLSIEEEHVIWDDIINNNIYVICNTPMAKAITKRTLLGFRRNEADDKLEPNIKSEKLVEQAQSNKTELVAKITTGGYWKGDKNNAMIKFNAVVGNPPYQEMDGGTERGAVPVYQYFVELAKALEPSHISMIIPARWYAGGRGLEGFRNMMLSDNRIEHLFDFELTNTIFPTVNIAGGICYFFWNSKHNGECVVHNIESNSNKVCSRKLNEFSVFVRNNSSISILVKIKEKSVRFLNELVLSINPFGFRTYYRGRNDKQEGDIKILTSEGWGFVKRSDVLKNTDLIDCYKIIIGRFVPSNGEMNVKPGEGYRVITAPKILEPYEINTETYIDTAIWKTSEEAYNYAIYLHCKFTRFLLRQAITSVNVTKECFAFVPLQDFSSKSDIDWKQSIPNIDIQLYKKYDLTTDEQNFIESMIKPLE
jgi:superfamily II DNA or RNA helicase